MPTLNQKLLSLFIFLAPLTCVAQSALENTAADTARRYQKSRFAEYEPNYFITNNGQNYFGQVKFKISFKFDFALPFRKNRAYFAYTQNAFWDIYRPSGPMREVDFTPTLFYEHDFDKTFSLGNWSFKVFDVKAGYLHQSDGQPAGRLNRSVFKFTGNADMAFTGPVGGQRGLGLDAINISIRTWIWNMVDPDNYNIAYYQGHGQLITTFKFDYNNKSRSTSYRSYPIEINDALTPAKAALSNELNLMLNPFIGNPRYAWVPYLFIQYFHGYGENLINYDNRYNNYKPLDELRAGLLFRVF